MALTQQNCGEVHDAILDYEAGDGNTSQRVLDWFASFFIGMTDEYGDPLEALPA